MNTILIVNNESLNIESSYQDESPSQSSFGGPWGNPELYSHLELPENVQLECAIAISDDNEIMIIEDEDKQVEYISKLRNDKLNQLRSQRDEKLKRVDQLINIAFLNSWTAGEKTELKDYRQALLDITESFKNDMSSCDDLDLDEMSWPEEPSEN